MLKLTIRTPEHLGERIRTTAKEKGLTINAWMVQACWDALERWENAKVQESENE